MRKELVVTSRNKPEDRTQDALADLPEALDYSKLVFENIIAWYNNADAKAQIILTLDGALVTFMTTSIFRKPAELLEITRSLRSFTWVLLTAMCLCLAGSIISALMCLWSRISLGIKRDSVLGREKKKIADGVKPYSPSVMLYFKTIAWLDHDSFQQQMCGTNTSFQVKALASQSFLLSERVYRKHVLVNTGFILAGAGLILFLAAGVSYMAGVK
jgi:hypothetical protein